MLARGSWPAAGLACLPFLAGCAMTLAAIPPGPDVRAWAGDADTAAAGDEAIRVLSDYLRIDTSNPPGNETAGVAFLERLLAADGIASERIELAPGRSSLVARLRGTGREPPLCLLSHVDVATAEAGKWQAGKGPFSGAIDETGTIWGRGSLDMKGMGVLELQVVRMLKRHAVPLRRDVVLLAVADEEVRNDGFQQIVERHWDRIGCSHLVNEGGIGIRDAMFDGQTVFVISVGEKGVLWVKLTAHGPAGHGSTPRPGTAPLRLLDALQALRAVRPEPRYHPALFELLARVGDHRGGFTGFVLARPGLTRSLATGRLMAEPGTAAALIDTVNVTGLDTGGNEPNMVPSESSALLDIRLLPGTRPEDVIARLEEATGHDPALSFEVIKTTPAAVSPWEGDPLYEALARNAVGDRRDAVAGPALSVGFTDSIYARAKGVRAYGFVPFEVAKTEAETMHGADERVSGGNVRRGLSILYRVVLETAADLAAPPPAHGATPP
jgi:acetylornithine deacetylase/succinyl-diaminopimelate desuccinylase-like protein